MSLWTPDGERPIQRSAQQSPQAESAASAGITPEIREMLAQAGVDVDQLTPEQIQQAMEMMAEMEQSRRSILEAPAHEVIVNHLMGIYELAALHLGVNPPNFSEAALAIEAFRGVLDRCTGKLGEHESQLVQALAQLQTAFVQLKEQVESEQKSS